MRKFMMLVGLTLGFYAASATPATPTAARNYDCTKAGNAHKAACKSAAASAAKAVAKSASKKAAPKPSGLMTARRQGTRTRLPARWQKRLPPQLPNRRRLRPQHVIMTAPKLAMATRQPARLRW